MSPPCLSLVPRIDAISQPRRYPSTRSWHPRAAVRLVQVPLVVAGALPDKKTMSTCRRIPLRARTHVTANSPAYYPRPGTIGISSPQHHQGPPLTLSFIYGYDSPCLHPLCSPDICILLFLIMTYYYISDIVIYPSRRKRCTVGNGA